MAAGGLVMASRHHPGVLAICRFIGAKQTC